MERVGSRGSASRRGQGLAFGVAWSICALVAPACLDGSLAVRDERLQPIGPCRTDADCPEHYVCMEVLHGDVLANECTPSFDCGDGVVEPGEVCDDGATDSCGPCNTTCSDAGSGGTCGDGIFCSSLEQCDGQILAHGACVDCIATCDAGWFDCDDDLGTGCECEALDGSPAAITLALCADDSHTYVARAGTLQRAGHGATIFDNWTAPLPATAEVAACALPLILWSTADTVGFVDVTTQTSHELGTSPLTQSLATDGVHLRWVRWGTSGFDELCAVPLTGGIFACAQQPSYLSSLVSGDGFVAWVEYESSGVRARRLDAQATEPADLGVSSLSYPTRAVLDGDILWLGDDDADFWFGGAFDELLAIDIQSGAPLSSLYTYDQTSMTPVAGRDGALVLTTSAGLSLREPWGSWLELDRLAGAPRFATLTPTHVVFESGGVIFRRAR